jgi:hypothetical protein
MAIISNLRYLALLVKVRLMLKLNNGTRNSYPGLAEYPFPVKIELFEPPCSQAELKRQEN